MSCVMSKDGASISRLIGLCLGRGAGGSATVSLDWDWDWVCAITEPAVSATAINAIATRMAPRLHIIHERRSSNIRDYVHHETNYRSNEEKRKNRMHEGNAADPGRGDGDIRRLIAHGNRERVIHEVPEVGRWALGKFEPQVVSHLSVDDRVVIIELHVMETKINMGQEPGEDHREQRRRHMEIDLPARPARRVVEHRRHSDEADYRHRHDHAQYEPVVRHSASRHLSRVLGRSSLHQDAELLDETGDADIVRYQQVEL